MKRTFFIFLTMSFLFIGCKTTQTNPEQRPNKQEYSQYLPALNEFISLYAKQEKNTLKICKSQNTEKEPYVYWAHWLEDNSLLYVPMFDLYPAEETHYSWLSYKARIDLVKGVVPTDDDIGSSNYLVSKRFVEKIINDCKTGDTLVIIVKKGKA